MYELLSTWYKCRLKAKDLVPIPIGVANFHSKIENDK